MVDGWEGIEYESGESVCYLESPVTSAPKAVTINTDSRSSIKTASGADDTIGILYKYNSSGGYALVQYGGWICAEVLGFSSPSIGDYLNVGNSGELSLSSSSTNAVGKVVYENTSGSHFIKLSI